MLTFLIYLFFLLPYCNFLVNTKGKNISLIVTSICTTQSKLYAYPEETVNIEGEKMFKLIFTMNALLFTAAACF